MKYGEITPTRSGWSAWMIPVQGYRQACCDCGLVHEFRFRLIKGEIQFQVKRHGPATGGVRSGMVRQMAKSNG